MDIRVHIFCLTDVTRTQYLAPVPTSERMFLPNIGLSRGGSVSIIYLSNISLGRIHE